MSLGIGFGIDNSPNFALRQLPSNWSGFSNGGYGPQKGFGMPPGYTQGPGQPVGGPVAPNQQDQQYQPYFQQMHQGMDNLQEGLKQVEQMVMPGQAGQSNGLGGNAGKDKSMFRGSEFYRTSGPAPDMGFTSQF